jgi:hypothetical protein
MPPRFAIASVTAGAESPLSSTTLRHRRSELMSG